MKDFFYELLNISGVSFFLKTFLTSVFVWSGYQSYKFLFLKDIILLGFPVKISVFWSIRIAEFMFFFLVVVLTLSGMMAYRVLKKKKHAESNQSALDSLLNKIDKLKTDIEESEKQKDDMFKELICKRRMMREIIDSVPVFIFGKDRDGKFFMVNKAVANCYGVHPKNMIGKTDLDFNPNRKEVVAFLEDDRDVIRTQKSKTKIEERITCADGHQKVLFTVKIPLRTWDDREGVLGISTDVSFICDALSLLSKGHCKKSCEIESILTEGLEKI